MSTELPNQRTSRKTKLANNSLHIKDSIDYYISVAKFADYSYIRRLANNELTETDYDTVLKKYKNQKFTEQKTDLRNVPLIKPILTLLAGEKRRSPFNYHTNIENADTSTKYLKGLEGALKTAADNIVLQALNESMELGLEVANPKSLSDVATEHKRTWKDSRVLAGQIIINNLLKRRDLKTTLGDLYKDDWIQLGEAYAFPYIDNNEVGFDFEKPENVWVRYSANSKKAEDGEVVVRKSQWTLSDIVDRFYDDLATMKYKGGTALDFLTGLQSDRRTSSAANYPRLSSEVYMELAEKKAKNYKKYNNSGSNFGSCFNNGLIDIYEVYYKTFEDYNILTYIDEFGQIQKTEVEGNYKLNKTHTLTKSKFENLNSEQLEYLIINHTGEDVYMEKRWVRVVDGGFKIPENSNADSPFGDNVSTNSDGIYLNTGKYPIQRNELNNNSKCKLPVVGRKDGLSIPKELQDYQRKYNIISLIEERTLAKDKGQPVLFPIDLVPNLSSWGTNPGERLETMMYYADTFNYIFFDGSSDKMASLAQAMKSVNMSTIQAVVQYSSLKEQVRAEAWEVIGMNRNRWGDVAASTGKAVNEQAQFKSALHTADMNVLFNKIEEDLLLAALDYSKIAYRDGKTFNSTPQSSDYLTDNTLVYELDPIEHSETVYGLTVQSSTEEQDTIQSMQALLQPFAQNGVAADAVMAGIQSNNPNEIKDHIKEAVEIQRSLEAKQQEAAQAAQQQLQETVAATAQAEMEFKKGIELAKLESNRLIAEMQEETKRMSLGAETNIDGKIDIETNKLNLEQQKVDISRKEATDKLTIAREGNKNKLQVQKLSNNNKQN